MNHFKDFKGFAITPGFVYEAHFEESPLEVACHILNRHENADVEIYYELLPTGTESKITTSARNLNNRLFDEIDNKLCDYVFIKIVDKESYIIQRIVIGNQSISQVEKDKILIKLDEEL